MHQSTQTKCDQNVFNYMLQGAHAFQTLINKKILKDEQPNVSKNVFKLYEDLLLQSE